ncbi:MAG: hypothetical protein REI94_18225 [Moraxellaceae bacterium]|nr:hypothetical protein [Moraxellaceae bacterium]
MTRRAWASTRKGLFELLREGKTWRVGRVSFLADPVTMFLPAGPDHPMIAALNLGHFGVKLHASDDDGATWREIATPAYPPQPEGVEGDVPWKLVQVWSMAAAGGVIWAGTLPGGLFRSTDRGESWQLVESLWNMPARREWMGGGYNVPGIHSICIDPTDPRRVHVAISCGGVWFTEDGGAGWRPRAQGLRADFMPPERQGDENIQDAHLIAQCASAPQVLWCQHHNGVWRTSNGGAHWSELFPPLTNFGFTVAAHPHDPETAWFVPAIKDERRVPVESALFVHRTQDGGKTFEELRKGLPQEHCYDLVYRHGLAVSPDGQHLMMGTTTGNLWASSDGGDSWQTVSNHLPPVFALRFDGVCG